MHKHRFKANIAQGSALALLLMLSLAGCAESAGESPGLGIALFTESSPNLNPIPADMPSVRVILQDHVTGQVLKHRTFGVAQSGVEFSKLPFSDQLQVVVEGLDINGNPILRGKSTPFAFRQSSADRRIPVFFTRLEAFSEATTLTVGVDGQPTVQPVRFSVAQSRAGHAQTPLSGGRILFTGGAVLGQGDGLDLPTLPEGMELQDVLGAAEVYDPATGSFFALQDMITPRAFHTTTQLADGRILVVGGVTIIETDDGPVVETVRPAEIFDPTTQVWTQVVGDGGLQTGRAWHTATLRRIDGKVGVIGGRSIIRGEGEIVGTAEVFNPIGDRFESNPGGGIIDMQHPRADHAAVLVRGGSGLGSDIVVIGGRDDDGPVARIERLRSLNSNTLFEFDDDLPNMEQPRYGHTSLPISPEGGALIMSVGGFGEDGNGALALEIFDPITGAQGDAGVLGTGRVWAQAVELPNTQNVMVFGGLDNDDDVVPTAEVLIYNADTGRYANREIVSLMNAPRFLHQASVLSNGLILLTGGAGPADGGDLESLNRVEIFNPNDGSPLPNTIIP